MDFGHRKQIENYKDKYTKEDEFLSQKNNFPFLFEAVFICISYIKVKKNTKVYAFLYVEMHLQLQIKGLLLVFSDFVML